MLRPIHHPERSRVILVEFFGGMVATPFEHLRFFYCSNYVGRGVTYVKVTRHFQDVLINNHHKVLNLTAGQSKCKRRFEEDTRKAVKGSPLQDREVKLRSKEN